MTEISDVIKEPEKAIVDGKCCVLLTTNDGKTRKIKDLESLTGLNRSTISNRLRNNHWSTPGILKKDFRGKTKPKEELDLDHIPDGDLIKLSTRDRAHLLSNIPTPTMYERELWR